MVVFFLNYTKEYLYLNEFNFMERGMNILFKNIPIGVSGGELARFIESEINGDILTGKKLSVHVGSIEMMERQDHYCRPIEQFGVVRVSPANLAEKVIKKMDGCCFNQFKVTVREYFYRSTANDKRLKKIASLEVLLEKRVKDRREKHLSYSRQI